ncbi:anti-sigma factor antagonist [Labedaea rhizosphaerae]|uniref:Anti-sigma factor antagonist n=1 Tax=Labedaea rhizosphaerae TaxID=598644 RepID=A0A4R6S8A3_LABRH|nr:anti-sigma factor antagonist [Labedaea rhizosphaerae]TDP95076.1 anti-anti-sigma factor [Labedaea rhizosphaerae]
MSDVDITAVPTRDALVLRLTGELDAVTSPSCRTSLSAVVAELPPPSLVVLDLRDVPFCGAAGARALAEFSADCYGRAVRVCLVAQPDSAVARIIDLVGLRDRVPVVGDPELATRRYA